MKVGISVTKDAAWWWGLCGMSQSYAGGSVAIGGTSHARLVHDEDPD